MEIEQTDWKQIESRNDYIKIDSSQSKSGHFIYVGHPSLENYYAIMWNHDKHIISICEMKNRLIEENQVIELEKYKYLMVNYNQQNHQKLFEFYINKKLLSLELKLVKDSEMSNVELKIYYS